MADNYATVPYVYPPVNHANWVPFRQFFVDAQAEPKNIAFFGDSQELLSNQGRAYLNWFNFFLHRLYNKAGVSPIRSSASFTTSTDYSWTSSENGNTVVDTADFPTSRLPPGFAQPRAVKFDGGAGLGWWGHFSHDGMNFWPGNRLSGADIFDKTADTDWYLKLYALTQDGSSEFKVNCRTTVSPSLITTGTTTSSSLISAIGTDDSNEWQVVSGEVGPLTWTDFAHYMQVQITSEDASGVKPALLGVQMVNKNVDQIGGIAATAFAAANYTISDVNTTHPNCWATLASMGMGMIVFKYGSTDISSASYESGLQTAITAATAANPDVLIVLISDPYRSDEPANLDEVSGVHRDIAIANANVVALNGRRYMEDLGFKAPHETYEDGDAEWIGAWADATAYSVGDLVYRYDGEFNSMWRCVTAHTSAAGTNDPNDSTNSNLFWMEVRKFLTNSDGTYDDTLHLSMHAQQMTAYMDLLMLTNSAGLNPAERSGNTGALVVMGVV